MYDGNTTTKTYDELGRPKTVIASGIYEREYEFDLKTANLNMRKDLLRNNTERFTYDGLDRLVEARLNGNLYLSMLYDDNGNIDNKSDIGDYTYHPTKKNAVVMVDNIQNLIHSTTQDIEYDELHNPKSIVENGNEWHFEYDVNHHRNRAQIISSGGSTETRVYVGNSEYQYDQNSDLLYSVDYVAGGDGLCALVVRDYTPTATTSEPQVFTVYKDYLGSINVLVDENGTVAAEQEFDPWGRYRDANTWTSSATLPALPSWLWRGYTGHEHIEEFQLINMNGRLYDPYIGRMLSPDNYVQDATSTQNYNRYSYALNNPLKYTDPSGELYLIDDLIVGGIAFTAGYVSSGVSSGDWGWSSVGKGLLSAGTAVLALNTGGLSLSPTGAALFGGQLVAGQMASSFLPSVNVPLTNNFSLSLNPAIAFSGSQLVGSVGVSGTFTDGNLSITAGVSKGNTFSSAFYGASYDNGKTGYSLFRTHYYSGNTSQTTFLMGFRSGDWSFSIQNDVALGDGGDRFRTAAFQANYLDYNVGFNLHTGDPGLKERDRKKELINGRETYMSGSSNDPSLRAGILYAGYGDTRFGVNSEGIRHAIQNRFAHDFMMRGKSPHFQVLNIERSGYFSVGTRSQKSLYE